MPKIICIDPGHGGKDPGAVNGKRYEKNDTLKLALKVRDILKSYNQTVFLTREYDKDVELNSRPVMANKYKADYFLSIHRNSFTNKTAKGVELWVYSKANKNTVKKAETILKKICAVDKKIVNRGVKKGYTGNQNLDYCVNRVSTMASALLELLYISTKSDNELFDKNIDELAKAIADGIMEALSEPIPKDNLTVIKKALLKLGVDENTALLDAKKIKDSLSNETMKAIRQYVN